MRHISIILLFVFSIVSTSAQNSAQKACIQKARTAYTDAIKSMKEAQEVPELDCSFHIQKHRNYSGSGPQTYTIDYFCHNVYEDEDESEHHSIESTLYFIRVHFNWAARQFTYEYTLNDNGGLLFCYQLCDDVNDGHIELPEDSKYEIRMYFNDDGTFCYGYQQIKHNDGKIDNVEKLNSDNAVVTDQQKFFLDLKTTLESITHF